MIGWNIFAWVAALTIAFALGAAIVSLCNKQYSKIAMVLIIISIAILGGFIVGLGVTLQRPPMRTMGETRLWYSFFMLVAGAITYARWRYRWVMTFATVMATVFMVINILRPEIHDHTLMPALQSVWFIPHVAVYMFSYALLGCLSVVCARRNLSCHRPLGVCRGSLLYHRHAHRRIMGQGSMGRILELGCQGVVGCRDMDDVHVGDTLAPHGQDRQAAEWSDTPVGIPCLANVLVWSQLSPIGSR